MCSEAFRHTSALKLHPDASGGRDHHWIASRAQQCSDTELDTVCRPSCKGWSSLSAFIPREIGSGWIPQRQGIIGADWLSN